MDSTPEDIRAAVRAHYGRVAETAEAGDAAAAESACSCCGYDGELLTRIPIEAVASSRGCGNPTALAALQPGEVVLDLGSGGGLDVFLAAQRVGPSGFVYGLDATPQMIELARRNAERAGIPNVRFLPGDLEEIPLPEASVDVILSNCVVNLTPDKARAVGEAFRVLRPGGRLAVSDIVIDPDLEGLRLEPDAVRRAVDWAGCAAGALTRGEWERALREAGFDRISIDVDYRMTAGELPDGGATLPAVLTKAEVDEVARRFTSSSISAHKPVR